MRDVGEKGDDGEGQEGSAAEEGFARDGADPVVPYFLLGWAVFEAAKTKVKEDAN